MWQTLVGLGTTVLVGCYSLTQVNVEMWYTLVDLGSAAFVAAVALPR